MRYLISLVMASSVLLIASCGSSSAPVAIQSVGRLAAAVSWLAAAIRVVGGLITAAIRVVGELTTAAGR